MRRFVSMLLCMSGQHHFEPVMTSNHGRNLLFRCYRIHPSGLFCLAERYEVVK